MNATRLADAFSYDPPEWYRHGMRARLWPLQESPDTYGFEAPITISRYGVDYIEYIAVPYRDDVRAVFAQLEKQVQASFDEVLMGRGERTTKRTDGEWRAAWDRCRRRL